MAEQFLHDAHVRATFHEVGRERMPEGVWEFPVAKPARSAAVRNTVQADWRESGPPRALRNRAGLPRPPAASAGRTRTR